MYYDDIIEEMLLEDYLNDYDYYDEDLRREAAKRNIKSTDKKAVNSLYRELIRKTHPDLHINDPDVKDYEEKTKKLVDEKEAYDNGKLNWYTNKQKAGAAAGAAVSAAGVATVAGAASKYSKFKKNAGSLYNNYKASGGTEDYDTWFKKQKRKYMIAGIGGAAATAAGAAGAGASLGKIKLKKTATNESIELFNCFTSIFDEVYYEGYNDTVNELLLENYYI